MKRFVESKNDCLHLFDLTMLLALMLGLVAPAWGATYDIAVLASGDSVSYRYWGYFGSGTWTEVNANPNEVLHRYSPGDGYSATTSLTFDLSTLSMPADDIESVSLNFNIVNIWTDDGRDNVATLGSNTVYYSQGQGWKYFDVTDTVKQALNAKTVDFKFNYTGYSGFQFSSAEGGQPAYLHIVTTAVPLPTALWLFGSSVVGLLGLGARNRRLVLAS